MMMTLSNGHTIESDITDAEAIARLHDIVDGKATVSGRSIEFAKSLLTQWKSRGQLTERQWPYVHKLVNEAIAIARQASSTELEKPQHDVGDFSRIYEMFETASKRAKYPKISFDLDDEDRVRLYPAGPNSKYAGSIMVTDDQRYPNSRWYGHVTRDGKFVEGKASNPKVLAFLKLFATYPTDVAAKYGRVTKICCFCAKQLTDKRSTEVGYGPICADKFGLPWG